jgi:polynucleotide 5'-hydroxyl-kinase GRC3/NOL9
MILALVKVDSPLAFRDLLDSEQDSDSNMDVDPPSSPSSSCSSTSTSSSPSSSSEEDPLPLIPNPLGRTLHPRYSHCLGLVLVRGIDTDRGELHILTPLPAENFSSMSEKLVLIAGKFDTPNWAYAEDSYLKRFSKREKRGDGEREDGVKRKVVVGEEESDDEEDHENKDGEDGVEEAGGNGRETVEDARVIGRAHDEVSWVEVLHGNQKKAAGSKVWRVRRDLGRRQ